MVKMPILLAGHTMNPAGIIRPLTMQQQWRVDSLSTASMELDDESPEVTVGDWIQIFAPNGMSGVFYVKSVRQDKVTKHNTVTLEHTMGLLADMVIFGEKTAQDMGGTGSTVPAGTAITYLLSQQTETLWTLYQNDFPNVAQGWKFTNSQILADLNDIADAIQDCQWEFDQSVFPWRLSLKAWPTDATMEMRMNRNIGSMKVSIDRSRMFTRCYPTGKNNKHIDTVNGGVSYLDRNTAIWGVVAQVITDNSIAEPALLKAWAEKQLKKNAEPAVTVSISGYELSKATGEPMDRIVPGRVCRVPLPKYETTITERVTELNWKNVMLDEESVTVTLANEHKTIAGVLNEKAGGGGGGKKSNTEHDCELGENEVKIEEFENADIWVNRESVWAVAGSYTVTTDAEGRHLTVKDGTALEVERDGAILAVWDEENLTAGVIVSKVNGGTAKLLGNRVVIGDSDDTVDDMYKDFAGSITEINGDLVVINSQMTDIESEQLDINTDITSLKSRVLTLETDELNYHVRTQNLEDANVNIHADIDGLESTIDTVSDTLDDIEGSALWQYHDEIGAFVGVMYKGTDGKLHIRDGSGLLIDSGSTSLGVYDEGSLTAGIIVNKINGGASTVKISADHIILDGEAVADSLESRDISVGVAQAVFVIASQDVTANNLTAMSGLKLGSYNAAWQSQAVVTSVTRTAQHAFLYSNGLTSTTPTGALHGTLVTAMTSKTIYYLGRSE